MNPMGNPNEESNIMSKYFMHQNQVENIPESNMFNNQINNANSQMNSSFESIMTSQTNLNNEIMNDLIGVESPDKKIIKLLRVFKKNIKLRNATIKKNFWKREYITNPNHLVIESAHPSPFSARNGFFGSKPFSKANNFLKEHNIKEVDWNLSK